MLTTQLGKLLRKYYLNKYLNLYNLHVDLSCDDRLPFFQRLSGSPHSNKNDGPLVSIIMPAHNAEATIELALGSLLNQTWENLQIIVVDDASTDSTRQKVRSLAKNDSRIELVRSKANVGPYVCRNLGVKFVRGYWLTVHDADDWAFPDRIEQQVLSLTAASAPACIGRMLRMNEHGQITRPIAGVSVNEDGYLRLCYSSLMVQSSYFRNKLGAWDSVRVGGDAELIERIKALGTSSQHLYRPLMLCLDQNSGLTNHEILGLPDVTGQARSLRTDYKLAFSDWHKAASSLKMLPSIIVVRSKRQKLTLLSRAPSKDFSGWTKDLELIKSSPFFDINWYSENYPYFKQTGMNPAEHYLTHGASDKLSPGPKFDTQFYLMMSMRYNPLIYASREKYKTVAGNRVLLSCSNIAQNGYFKKALSCAEEYLPTQLKHTVHILKANEALMNNNESEWQACVNAYLNHFGVAPICLEAGESDVFNRLSTAHVDKIMDGPLISVIIAAWNAEKTIFTAARSILDQTWHNLELLIVDDASTDGTWTILEKIAASDERVRIYRNSKNVGPYASKNKALLHAKGEWVTGHDADDWSLPTRLQDHLSEAITKRYDASLGYMIRITSKGYFSHIASPSAFSIDGVARKSSISCLFKRRFMVEKLGFWDTVRFGADSEMIFRAEKVLGHKFGLIKKIGMICQDLETSLTNDPMHGVDKAKGISPIRANYRSSWESWMQNSDQVESFYLPFPQLIRRYKAPAEMEVPIDDILSNLR